MATRCKTCPNGYVCFYVPGTGRVCVSTTEIAPAIMYYYTRADLRALIAESPAWDYRLGIYREALGAFPEINTGKEI
jgi:hypothetical protein